jgi:hypothetical protein
MLANIKNSLLATHRVVDAKHLPRYLGAFAWRFNLMVLGARRGRTGSKYVTLRGGRRRAIPFLLVRSGGCARSACNHASSSRNGPSSSATPVPQTDSASDRKTPIERSEGAETNIALECTPAVLAPSTIAKPETARTGTQVFLPSPTSPPAQPPTTRRLVPDVAEPDLSRRDRP